MSAIAASLHDDTRLGMAAPALTWEGGKGIRDDRRHPAPVERIYAATG
jgi:hypothetical protein